MTDRDILVLLSSHNGEAFIADQIRSLADQSVADRMRLVVRDDGSTDSTVDLVSSMDCAPLSVEVLAGDNLGVVESFSALMALDPGNATTVMLCDQDDVWMPDKAAAACRAVESAPGPAPLLYCGRSVTTDAGLNPVSVTADAPRDPSLRHALFQNIAPGHTMAFNRALLDLYRLSVNPDAIMHDWWLYCLAASLGTVQFDPRPHAYYRLHSANEVGYASTPVKRLASRLTRLVTEDRAMLTRQAAALMTMVGDRLASEDHDMLAAFLDQETLGSRLGYLRRYPLVSQTSTHPVASTVLFAAGAYRDRRPRQTD